MGLNIEDITEDVEEELEERSESKGLPYWKPDEEGQSIVGVITRMRKDPFNEGEELFEVKTRDNELLVLPSHKILMSSLEDQFAEPGDAIRAEFGGEVKTSSGWTAKDYKVGVVKASEGRSEPSEKKVEEPEEKEKVEEEEKEEQAEEEKEEKETEKVNDEVIGFVKHMIDFEDEVSIEELDKYLNEVRQFDVSPHEAASAAGFKVEDGVVKK